MISAHMIAPIIVAHSSSIRCVRRAERRFHLQVGSSSMSNTAHCCGMCDEVINISSSTECLSRAGVEEGHSLHSLLIWSLVAGVLFIGGSYICILCMHKFVIYPLCIYWSAALAELCTTSSVSAFFLTARRPAIGASGLASAWARVPLCVICFAVVFCLSHYRVVKKRLFFSRSSGVAYTILKSSRRPGQPTARFPTDRRVSAQTSQVVSSWKKFPQLFTLSGGWFFVGDWEGQEGDLSHRDSDMGAILHFDVHSTGLVSVLLNKPLAVSAATVACVVQPFLSPSLLVAGRADDASQPSALDGSSSDVRSLAVQGLYASVLFSASIFSLLQMLLTFSRWCVRTRVSHPRAAYRSASSFPYSARRGQRLQTGCRPNSDTAHSPPPAEPSSRVSQSVGPGSRLALPRIAVCTTSLSSCSHTAVFVQDLCRGRQWGVSPSLLFYSSAAASLFGLFLIPSILNVLRSPFLVFLVSATYACLAQALYSWCISSQPSPWSQAVSADCRFGLIFMAAVSSTASIFATLLHRKAHAWAPRPAVVAIGMFLGSALPFELLVSTFLAAYVGSECDGSARTISPDEQVARGTFVRLRPAVLLQCLWAVTAILLPATIVWLYVQSG
eukprot:Gregarina_sp_Poly_1__9816@NODE_629_length_7064_cov_625_434043_g482_i0_p2_GENE_NODE_629_length_7064_cov_625_434043_g482_i0NODE_629_length_7064_cov_625_434043_g482_i0_p2_ORF_typecomplete_len614_score43_11_NODE_629_length_7064_cov_625_434043_g482_i032765117